MSYSLFSALAAAVTVAGFATVVWTSRLAAAIPPSRRRLLAFGLLAAFAAALLCRPAAWPVIDLAVLAGAVGGVLLVKVRFDVQVSWEDVPQALAIRSLRIPTNPEAMDATEALLKRFDVPERSVELTVYLIRAESLPPRPPDPRVPEPAPNPVPADLKAAIDEMKGAFNYDHYVLWDTIVLQPKSTGEVQGILQSHGGAPSVYNVIYSTAGLPTESGALTLSLFQFSIKFGDIDSRIKESDVTIREGQKLVLGKIRLLNANADLFLVLTTKVH